MCLDACFAWTDSTYRDVAEAAPTDAVEMKASVEKAIRKAVEGKEFHEVYDQFKTRIRHGAAAVDSAGMEENIRKMFAAYLRLLYGIEGLARNLERSGDYAENIGEFRDKIRAVEDARDGMLTHWPRYETKAAEAGGEGVTLDEVFAAARGVSVEEWRRLSGIFRAPIRST